MIVMWSELALEKWQAIADYIFSRFGHSGLQEYDVQTRQWEAAIADNPSIGAVEPLLQGRMKVYRYVIVHRQTKMIYFVEGETIVIANLWDTRQEPKVQSNMII